MIHRTVQILFLSYSFCSSSVGFDAPFSLRGSSPLPDFLAESNVIHGDDVAGHTGAAKFGATLERSYCAAYQVPMEQWEQFGGRPISRNLGR